MLRAARDAAAGGGRVVAADPAPLDPGFEGLERLAGEFRLDLALARRPSVLLLSDLARRNPEGQRHRRRHQDVQELLAAGVSVWTTLDVRELESLVEVVAQITGSPPRETVPDSVFDEADEVELIDVPLADAGGAPAEALRELALRRAADRLGLRARREASDPSFPGARPWRTRERLLVCVGPSPTSSRVVRTASRMASSMHAQWIAINVSLSQSAEDERRLAHNLKLAEALGAETVSLSGADVAEEIVRYARARGATKIVIGKTGPSHPWRLGRSVVDRVIAASGDMDVYVIRGVEEDLPPQALQAPERRDGGPWGYAIATLVLAVSTGVAAAFSALGLAESNLVLSYLLGVAAVGAWHGRGPAIYFSCAAVLAFNFFFTAPEYTLRVDDSQYLFTFAVMLVIGVLVSTLTARVREQSEAARVRQRRTEVLYRVTQELSAASGVQQVVAVAERLVAELLRLDVAILVAEGAGALRPVGRSPGWLEGEASLHQVAEWAYAHGKMAGAGTETLAGTAAVALPLTAPAGPLGALLARSSAPDLLVLPEPRRVLETLAGQVAQAIQRERLAEGIHRAMAQAEAERLRNALLTSVSHDLRTPLASIAGASSSLIEAGDGLERPVRDDLLRTIFAEADRLSRFIDSLLQMTRIAAGRVVARREWHVVEDLIGSALTRASQQLAGRQVTTRLPGGLPLVSVDGVLIEHVLVNLLENAAKYSPEGAPIEVEARADDAGLTLQVTDRGPGVGDDEKTLVFDKFYRGARPEAQGARGAGLGLTICEAIVVQLHGGRIWVEDAAPGGARFCVELPLEEQPPELPEEAMVEPSWEEVPR